jgi:hypothetical protein
LLGATFVLFIGAAASAQTNEYPFLDARPPLEDRVNHVVSMMTLPESSYGSASR